MRLPDSFKWPNPPSNNADEIINNVPVTANDIEKAKALSEYKNSKTKEQLNKNSLSKPLF